MLQEGAATDSQCPSWAPVLGYMGVAAAVGLSNWGSAVRLLDGYPMIILSKGTSDKGLILSCLGCLFAPF